MKTFAILALALASSLFLSSTFAAPLNKRDLVVVTLTSNVVETVDVTTTVYVGADPTGAADSAPITTSAVTTITSTPVPSSTQPSSSAAAAAPTTSSTPPYVAPTTSSTPPYVAPTTSSIPPYVAPTSTPSSTLTPAAAYTPPTTSSPAPAATSGTPPTSNGTPGACSTDGKCTSSGTPCCGDITHYDTDAAHQARGACGWINDGATEDVVALPHGMMGEQSNGNPFCGRTVNVSLNGKTASAKVVDKCMGCEGQSIDLSDHLFGQLGNPDIGRTQAKWWFTS